MVISQSERDTDFPRFKVPPLAYAAPQSNGCSPRHDYYPNLPMLNQQAEPNNVRRVWPDRDEGPALTPRDALTTPRLRTTNQMYGAFGLSPRVGYGEVEALPPLEGDPPAATDRTDRSRRVMAGHSAQANTQPPLTSTLAKLSWPDKRYKYYDTESECARRRARGDPFGRPRSNFQPTMFMAPSSHYVVDPEWVSERLRVSFGGEKRLLVSSRVIPASSRARMNGYDPREVQKVATPRCPVQPGWNYM